MAIDLRGWKLTLPVGKPDEIRDLEGFRSEHFERTPDGLCHTFREWWHSDETG